MIKELLLKLCRIIRGEVPLEQLQKNGLKCGKNLYRQGETVLKF